MKYVVFHGGTVRCTSFCVSLFLFLNSNHNWDSSCLKFAIQIKFDLTWLVEHFALPTGQDVDNQWEQEMWGRTSWRPAKEYNLLRKKKKRKEKKATMLSLCQKCLLGKHSTGLRLGLRHGGSKKTGRNLPSAAPTDLWRSPTGLKHTEQNYWGSDGGQNGKRDWLHEENGLKMQ